MILSHVKSVNGITIRLTEERRHHIVIAHQEIKNNDFPKIMRVISKPDFLF